jgi:hypothetical protein
VGVFVRERTFTLLAAAAALAQGVIVWLGLPAWRCPFHMLFGVPCPGCGLSRGFACLLRGEFAEAVKFHAFSPLFAAAGVFLAVCCLLPAPLRAKAADALDKFDARTRLTFVVLSAFVVYGVVRMLSQL